MAIVPVLTYGSQTWSMSRNLEKKLEVNQRAMERSLLKISRFQKIRNESIREITKFEDVVQKANIQKWKWAGHVTRLEDNRWTKRTTEWIPRDGLRRVGRQCKRWRDDLTNFNQGWTHIAHDRNHWKSLGEAYARR